MSSHLLSLLPHYGPRHNLGHSLAQSVSAGLLPILGRAVEAPIDWIDRIRDRRQLAALSDAMLKDIGVSRADVEHEAEKHFWQA
jgi:uncharacterized protein YjiS (DUF1127 family)